MKVGDLVRIQCSGRASELIGIILSEPYEYNEKDFWSSTDGFIVVDVRFFGRHGLRDMTHQYTPSQLEVVSESRRSC
jgi:hypothetical protein